MKTGATLLVKEGVKACAKQAAVAATGWTASVVAAEMANYAANLAGLSEEQRHWLKIGVDAFQIFAFLKVARARMGPGGVCFVAGTQVVTGVAADGSLLTKSIEDIAVGDLVLARDQYDVGDNLDPRRVTNVFRKTSDHLRTVTVAGDSGNVESIRTTDEHPFYVQGKGWTSASDLQIGDRVQETDGSWQTVLACERAAHPNGVTVYNVEVEGDHTYFVADSVGGTDAIWVHNRCHVAADSVAIAQRYPRAARDSLRGELGLSSGDGLEAHPLIPIAALKQQDVAAVLARAANGNFHFNGMANGKTLPSGHGAFGPNSTIHNQYNSDVIAEIRRRQNEGRIFDDASAATQMSQVAAEFKLRIERGDYWPL